MPKTRKIQVTLEEEQYEELRRLARRDGKKLAAIVRESVVRYCLNPEANRAKAEALQDLLSLQPTSAPESYREWKREYATLKTKGKSKKA